MTHQAARQNSWLVDPFPGAAGKRVPELDGSLPQKLLEMQERLVVIAIIAG